MKAATTVVDVIEGALGERLTEGLVRRGLPPNVCSRIASAYYNYERDPAFALPSGEGNEVVPYIHPSWPIGADLGSIGSPVASADHSADVVERLVKKLLLYYHRIAIPDGFSYECDFGGVYPGRENRFLFYLLLFSRLRALIQRGIIMVVPEIPTFFPAREAVNERRNPALRDALESELGPGPHSLVQEVIEQSLWVGAHFDLDLFLPTARVLRFFQVYNEILSRAQLPRVGALDASGGSLLLTCDLPALDKISLSDLVRIRQDAESFSVWRARLRRVLLLTYDDFLAERLSGGDLAQLAAEEFADAKQAIEKDIAKSSALGLAKTGARSVGIGLVTGVVTATVVANPLTVLTALAASASSTFLWDYIRGLRGRRTRNTLRMHYAVWDATSD